MQRRPIPLPLKQLNWSALVHEIGEAREALGRYDELLRSAPSVTHLCAENERRGLLFATRWVEAKKPLNIQFFRRVHAIVKSKSSEAGSIRTRQNWIGAEGSPIEEAYFLPPSARNVMGHLEKLVRYMHRKEPEPLVQTAIAFAQFLTIHPFMDGNGRVIRVWVSAYLYKKGLLSRPALFLSGYFFAHKLSYSRNLFLLSEKSGWERWIAYFLKGVSLSARAASLQL